MEETYSLRLNRHLELGKTSRRTARVSVKTVSLSLRPYADVPGEVPLQTRRRKSVSQAELETPPFYDGIIGREAGWEVVSRMVSRNCRNEVTLGDFWCVSATVSNSEYVTSHQRRELLNHCTG